MFSSPNRVILAFIACAILFAIVLISALDQPAVATTSRIYTEPVHTASAPTKTIVLEPMVITAKRLTPTQLASAKKPAQTTLEDTRI
jgi:hypothetical protein